MATDSPIGRFLLDQYCLVVEPSPAFSSSIQACLYGLGVPTGKVLVCRNFQDACRLMDEKRPKLLVTEYQIEPHLGLALIEYHEKIYNESSRISMLVTRNSSDSVVAEAAEEQVDAFLLKPFSVDMFQQKLISVLHRKLNPSPYTNRIRSSKELMALKNFDAAVQELTLAKSENPKPTLACFYSGEIYRLKGDQTRALAEFREGRAHQPLHYKCLVAEFECLLALKRYPEAFELVNLLKSNYPVTPKRLIQILIATVFARRFDDLADYYDLFLRLDERSPELIKVTSMALFTAGKFYLGKADLKKAVSVFEKSVLITGRRLEFLEKVISELVKVKAKNEAEFFLTKVAAADVGSLAHNRLSFKVDQLSLSPDHLMEKGRKLVMAGGADREILQIVVRLMVDCGKTTLAETVIGRAVASYPDMREGLYKILSEATPPKSARPIGKSDT